MSNALVTRTIYTAIEAAIVSAWSGITKVYSGRPRETPTHSSLPYAVLSWDGMDLAPETVTKKAQEYSFTIIGRFAYPSDSSHIIDLEKSDRASELIAVLQAASTFAGCYQPLVTRVEPNESDELAEEAYEVALTFTCINSADHH